MSKERLNADNIDDAEEILASLQNRRREHLRNIRILEEKQAEYISQKDIPLQSIRDLEFHREQLVSIEQKIEEIDQRRTHPQILLVNDGGFKSTPVEDNEPVLYQFQNMVTYIIVGGIALLFMSLILNLSNTSNTSEGFTQTIPSGIPMDFVGVSQGSFIMGSSDTDL